MLEDLKTFLSKYGAPIIIFVLIILLLSSFLTDKKEHIKADGNAVVNKSDTSDTDTITDVESSVDTLSESSTKIGNIDSIGGDLDISKGKTIDNSVYEIKKNEKALSRTSTLTYSDTEELDTSHVEDSSINKNIKTNVQNKNGIAIDDVQELIDDSSNLVRSNIQGYIQSNSDATSRELNRINADKALIDADLRAEEIKKSEYEAKIEAKLQQQKNILSTASSELYKNQDKWDVELNIAKNFAIVSQTENQNALNDFNQTFSEENKKLKSDFENKSDTIIAQIDTVQEELNRTIHETDKEIKDSINLLNSDINKTLLEVKNTLEVKTIKLENKVELNAAEQENENKKLENKIENYETELKQFSTSLINETKRELDAAIEDKQREVFLTLNDYKNSVALSMMELDRKILEISSVYLTKEEFLAYKYTYNRYGEIYLVWGLCKDGSQALDGSEIYEDSILNLFNSSTSPNFMKHALIKDLPITICIKGNKND